MAITITETIQKQIFYPQLGVYMPGEAEETSVTYSAFNVSVEDGQVKAQFNVTIDGCLIAGHRDLTFTPDSINGDLVSISESALKSAIENPTNEADEESDPEYQDTNVDNPL